MFLIKMLYTREAFQVFGLTEDRNEDHELVPVLNHLQIFQLLEEICFKLFFSFYLTMLPFIFYSCPLQNNNIKLMLLPSLKIVK